VPSPSYTTIAAGTLLSEAEANVGRIIVVEAADSYIRFKLITVHASRSGRDWVCQVVVALRGRRTEHTVTVSPGSLARWGAGSEPEDVEDLVRRSFEFLLEREPPGAILREFELSVIETYFPEYDELIRSTPG
jgi:hypothetical protein